MRSRTLGLRIALVAPLALAACTAEPETPAFDMEAWAQDYFAAETAAFERGEYEGLLALDDPNVVFQNINGNVFGTQDGHIQSIKDFRAQFDNAPIHQKWTYLMGDDDIFAASYEWTIDVPEQSVLVTGMLVGRVVGGRLVEEWGAANVQPAPAGGE